MRKIPGLSRYGSLTTRTLNSMIGKQGMWCRVHKHFCSAPGTSTEVRTRTGSQMSKQHRVVLLRSSLGFAEIQLDCVGDA